MVELILLVVVGTSIWVAIDARSAGDNWVAWSLGSLVTPPRPTDENPVFKSAQREE